MGGSGNRFLPQSAGPSVLPPASSAADSIVSPDELLGVRPDGSGRDLPVAVTMRIPKYQRGERAAMHPSTISPFTQSVGISVNSGKAKIFNATTASSNCTAGGGVTTCTFKVAAPSGNDKFVVTTYSAVNGGGAALNRGTAVFAIKKGKANSPHIVLGPLVSTTADTGMGSLRYAVGTSNPGDTIIFSLAAGAKITLTTPITLNSNVNITGPGVKSSLRTRKNRRGLSSNTTFSGITISGGGAQQVFVVNTGVKATITGLIITDGKASVATHPGGAISNLGNLTLASDAITDSTSVVTNLHVRPHGVVNHAKRMHPAHKIHAPVHKHPARVKPGPWGLRPHVCGTDQYGGALYNNGTLTITGTTFDSNTVADDGSCTTYGYGGAIYNDSNGSIFSSNSTYSNNGAGDGGAIYNVASYGQISFTGDKFISNFGCNQNNGCATSGCSTASSCTVYAYGYGSAIQDDDGPGVTITNSTFTNNLAGGNQGTAYGDGGALYLTTGSPLITKSTFTGNVAGGSLSHCGQGYGGAIYEDASGPIELDNDIFTNNAATGDEDGYGGAIYNDAQPDQGSGNTFTGNVALAPGSDCEEYPYAYGGALYADYGVSMSNSTFKSNSTSSSYETEGGAIYTDDPSVLNGDTFTSNSTIATSATDTDSYAYGGAFESDSTMKVTNSTFTSNSTQALGAYGYYVEGGVIYASSTLNSSGNTFTLNSVLATYPDDAYVYGGVIYADSTLLSSKDTFKSNTATSLYDLDGGVIYENSSANISSDTFASNSSSAPFAYGGAIENDGSTSNVISNSIFTNNVAGTGYQSGWGGAVYDDYATTYNGDTLTGNSAPAGGGAIYDDDGDTINNSTFTGNVVTSAQSYYGGGAIYDAGGTTVNNSTFTGNVVTPTGIQSGGGAIYNDDGLTMTGSTLSGNKVMGSVSNTGGGGIFNYDDLYVYNSTLSSNSSTVDGGAYDAYYNYSVDFYNSTLYGNTASRNGGNIENPYSMYLYNSIVAGGTAGIYGPDIDNSGSASLWSGGYNIIGKGVNGSGTFTSGTGDQIGTAVAPKNPGLAALSMNGGPTQTMADSAISIGYHKIPMSGGSCNGTGITSDQRGFSRGLTSCDIGAFQFGAAPSTMRVHGNVHRARGHHHPHARRHHRDPIEHPSHKSARHGVTK